MDKDKDETTLREECERMYREITGTIFDKLSQATDMRQFIYEMNHIQNANMECAVNALLGTNGLEGEAAKIASQFFASLSALLPSNFFQAVSNCGDGAAFAAIRERFLSLLRKHMTDMVDILLSENPSATAKDKGNFELRDHVTPATH